MAEGKIMLKIFTSTVRYKGPNRLDITVGSGDLVFAPSWEMVRLLKAGKMEEETYEYIYNNRMLKSYGEHRARWNEVLAMNTVVLCCYCKPGHFCHRLILAKILVTLAGHGAEYLGEIP